MKETTVLAKLIHHNWGIVSAYAWGRYLQSGRGAVMVDMKDINPLRGGLVNYISYKHIEGVQQVPEGFKQAIGTYDPQRQVLFIILHKDNTISWCTVSKPRGLFPEEAFKHFKAELVRLTVSTN